MIAIHRRSNQACAEVNTEGSWAISYGDMITLLLMFFVLFFSIDRKLKDEEKMVQVQAELVALFKSKPSDAISAKPSDISQAMLQNSTVETYRVGQRVIVVFPGISFFNSAETKLTKRGAQVLADFARKYLPFSGSYTLGIRAYTDGRPVVSRQRYKDNLELSALRSISAMRVLQNAGVPLRRMRLGGLGENRTTLEELRKIASVSLDLGDKKGDPLSRKIALVIEPESQNNKEAP